MKQTLTFIPDQGHYHVEELGFLCSLPHVGKVVTIENYSVGIGHSAHPNIDASGSVSGMKKQGYWKKDDITVRQNGFIYNISKVVCTDILDELCLAIEENRYKFSADNGIITYTFETEKDYK